MSSDPDIQSTFLLIIILDSDDTNEGTIFAITTINSTTDFVTFMENQFPALSSQDASTIVRLYPKSDQFPNHGEFFSAASNAYGEMTFTCAGILLSSVINKISGGKPTWNYRFVTLKYYLI